MQITFLRDIVLTVHTHEIESGKDSSYDRLFRNGDTYWIGEHSPLDQNHDMIEFERLGYAEVPSVAWVGSNKRIAMFFLDKICKN